MEMPRVLYIVNAYPELSQTFVFNEVEALRNRGFEVSVLALRRGNGPGELRADYYLSDISLWVALRAWARIALRDYRSLPSLISHFFSSGSWALPWIIYTAFAADACNSRAISHIHTHFASRAAVFARAVSLLSGVPRSITMHAADIYCSPSRLLHVASRDAAVATISEFNIGVLTKMGVKVSRLIRCGVDLPLESALVRHEKQYDVVSVGRLVPKKGHDLLMQSVARMSELGDAPRCIVIGDGPEKSRLIELRAELGLEKCVEFAGALSAEETKRVIASSRTMVLACRVDRRGDADGLPVALMEAAAARVSMISTAVTGIPELVTPETGWCVPPEDSEALACAIREALANPLLASKRSASARSLVERDFSLTRQVEELTHLVANT